MTTSTPPESTLPSRSRGRAWTATEDRELTKLHAAGLSLHAIAKKMGRPKSVVSKYAAALRLDWDRTGTAAATVAVQVNNRARRALAVSRMYDRIEHLQDRLEAPTFRSVLRGLEGDTPTDLDFVPTVDERNIADTITRYAAMSDRSLYGPDHQRERARWARHLAHVGPVACSSPWCKHPDQPIRHGDSWDLGHTADRAGWAGPQHPDCNRGTNAHRAARRKRPAARHPGGDRRGRGDSSAE